MSRSGKQCRWVAVVACQVEAACEPCPALGHTDPALAVGAASQRTAVAAEGTCPAVAADIAGQWGPGDTQAAMAAGP